MATNSLKSAYHYCEKFSRSHNEFFPIASFILPKKMRRPICVVYTFARTADDIADEGNFSESERLSKLDYLWQSLEALGQDPQPNDPLFRALKDVLNQNKQLPISLFFDLLRAFKQDVIKREYESTEEVLQYAHYSANPVGRSLLYLTQNAREENLKYSDAICTALQLINFIRDIHSDLQDRNRCYLPKDEMKKRGITIDDFRNQKRNSTINQFILQQLNEAESLLNQGVPLGNALKGFFGFEIRLIIKHNQHMIKLLRRRHDIYTCPRLQAWDWTRLFWNTLAKKQTLL